MIINRAAAHLREAGVREVHSTATPADFPQLYDRIMRFVEDGKRSLLISGGVGTGKTHLAAAIARMRFLADSTVQFMLARQLFRSIWNTYRDGSERSEEAVISELCSLGLLVIDDMGPGREGRVTEAVCGALHEIVTRRVDNGLPMVITTNMGLEDIGQHYGDAIKSRLASFSAIVLRGADRRMP